MEKDARFSLQRELFQQAIENGAHLQKPKGFVQDNWDRTINGLTTLFYNPEITQLDLSALHNRTKQAESAANNRALRSVLGNAPEELRALYPATLLEGLSAKPDAMKTKLKKSEVRGGNSAAVYKKMQEGMTFELAVKELQLDTQKIGDSKYTLKRWNVTVDSRLSSADREKKLAEESITDEEVRVLFVGIAVTFYSKNVQGETPLLSRFGKLAHDYKFVTTGRYGLTRLYEKVNALVPIGMAESIHSSRKFPMRYYYHLTSHTQRVEDVLRTIDDEPKFW